MCVPAVTPPGYKTVAGSTTECADGEYRADWKPAAAADSCQVCGDNILSSATEQITAYDISTEAPSPVYVRATGAACCEYCYCLLAAAACAGITMCGDLLVFASATPVQQAQQACSTCHSCQ